MTARFAVADAVATITLDRPDRRNAIDAPMREALTTACQSVFQDPLVRSVLIDAKGPSFCAGADTGEMGTGGVPGSRARMRLWHDMTRALNRIDRPVVAAVRGSAVGIGWSIALAADFVVASETARFAQIFRNIALVPDGAAIWHLTRRIGVLAAKDLVFSGRFVAAQEALELGLVSQVVPDAQLEEAAAAKARELAGGPTLALGMSKWLFSAATQSSLDEFLELELVAQSQLTQGGDFREGVEAFKAKRPPRFKGS